MKELAEILPIKSILAIIQLCKRYVDYILIVINHISQVFLILVFEIMNIDRFYILSKGDLKRCTHFHIYIFLHNSFVNFTSKKTGYLFTHTLGMHITKRYDRIIRGVVKEFSCLDIENRIFHYKHQLKSIKLQL